MTIAEAVAAITSVCPESEDTTEAHIICSGGQMIGDKMPALYASEHLALKAFVASVLALLDGAEGYRFLDGPHLDRYAMTVETPRRQHRITEPRWAVTAKMGVKRSS
jgi:hypothetical protein